MGDLGVKNHLEQDIAQFLLQFLRIAVVERVEQLVSFFEQARL